MAFTSNEWRAAALAYNLPVSPRWFRFHADEFVTSPTIWTGERFHWLLRHDGNARLKGSHRTSKRSQSEQPDNCHDSELQLTRSRTLFFLSLSFCFSQNVTGFHRRRSHFVTPSAGKKLIALSLSRSPLTQFFFLGHIVIYVNRKNEASAAGSRPERDPPPFRARIRVRGHIIRTSR